MRYKFITIKIQKDGKTVWDEEIGVPGRINYGSLLEQLDEKLSKVKTAIIEQIQ